MIEILFIHQIWDYITKFEKSKYLVFKSMYTFFKKKLEIFYKYLKEKLKKKFIKKSQLLI